MKNTEAWGFLVSRNQYLDYRTVVAPKFMCEASVSGILAKAAEGSLTEQGTVLYRKIHNSKGEDLTLIFRVIEAAAGDTGIPGNGILKDSFGREICLIEGIVLKESAPNILLTQENIEEVHKQLIEYYRKFWDATTPVPAVPSEPFTLQEQGNLENGLKYIPLKDYMAGTKELALQKSTEPPKASQKQWESVSKYESEGEIVSIAVFPDGDRIAIRAEEKIIIYSLKQSQKLTELCPQRRMLGGYFTPAVVDSTGKLIASGRIEGCDQNIIKLWELKNTQASKNLGEYGIGGFCRVKAVAFAPDSKMVISGGRSDGTIKLWDVENARCELGELNGHDSEVRCMAVDGNKGILASGDNQGYIKIWNLRSRKEIKTIKGHSLPINSLVFSPDGQTLASGSDDDNVKLWNVKTGKEYDVKWEHSASVNSVAFNWDGNLVASGSDDGKIKLWDFQSKKGLFEQLGHNQAVTSVVFSADGSTLISGSKDRTVRVWQQVQSN